jgi:hypothetical protein
MKRQILFSVLAILAMILVMTIPALAQVQNTASGTGSNLGQAFSDLIGSNIALIIGVAMALFGLYEWLVAQNTAVGLGMIVFGIAIAFVPNIFQGLKTAVSPIFNKIGTNNATMAQ